MAKKEKTPEWYEQSHANHMEFVRRATEKGRLTSEREICEFLGLAIAGEAGELANLFKKQWRGDAVPPEKFPPECADIYIYLKHLAYHLGFDLDEAAAEKVSIVTDRLRGSP